MVFHYRNLFSQLFKNILQPVIHIENLFIDIAYLMPLPADTVQHILITVFFLVDSPGKGNGHLPAGTVAAGMAVEISFLLRKLAKSLKALFNLRLGNRCDILILLFVAPQKILQPQLFVKLGKLLVHTLPCGILLPSLSGVLLHIIHNIIHGKEMIINAGSRPPITAVFTV